MRLRVLSFVLAFALAGCGAENLPSHRAEAAARVGRAAAPEEPVADRAVPAEARAGQAANTRWSPR